MVSRLILASACAAAAASTPAAPSVSPSPRPGAALRGSSSGGTLQNLNVSASASGLNAAVASAPQGCVHVERFVVANQCGRDIFLKGWNQRVPPGEVTISGPRSSDIQRISWRLVDGPWDYDYIELSTDWAGAGTDLCAHPNYVTWYGFSTSSRYEALDPNTNGLACADAGAEVNFHASSCPTGGSERFECDLHATQSSVRDCVSAVARYQEEHTFAINGDGSRTSRYSCAHGGEWCGNWANYPCAPESHNWPGYRVGSWIDCTNRGVSIVFKLTVCI